MFDVNVLIDAVVWRDDNSFEAWPSPPPVSRNPAADCVGIINDAVEFGLWLSPHILDNVDRVLSTGETDGGYEWAPTRVEEYLEVLVDMAEGSGGGVVDPDFVITDCPDYEDNRILEAAWASQSVLIVANDKDLVEMSPNPWRGTPIIRPREFVGRVDAMRRSRRHRH